jgi:hypothetical protein
MDNDSSEEIEFEIESWDKIKNRDFALLTSGKDKKNLFLTLGYQTLPNGDLFDSKKKEKVMLAGRNEFVNLNRFKGTSLIAGSHNFVRNIADYSELLVRKGELKFTP